MDGENLIFTQEYYGKRQGFLGTFIRSRADFCRDYVAHGNWKIFLQNTITGREAKFYYLLYTIYHSAITIAFTKISF